MWVSSSRSNLFVLPVVQVGGISIVTSWSHHSPMYFWIVPAVHWSLAENTTTPLLLTHSHSFSNQPREGGRDKEYMHVCMKQSRYNKPFGSIRKSRNSTNIILAPPSSLGIHVIWGTQCNNAIIRFATKINSKPLLWEHKFNHCAYSLSDQQKYILSITCLKMTFVNLISSGSLSDHSSSPSFHTTSPFSWNWQAASISRPEKSTPTTCDNIIVLKQDWGMLLVAVHTLLKMPLNLKLVYPPPHPRTMAELVGMPCFLMRVEQNDTSGRP